jgi:hypothetical protein
MTATNPTLETEVAAALDAIFARLKPVPEHHRGSKALFENLLEVFTPTLARQAANDPDLLPFDELIESNQFREFVLRLADYVGIPGKDVTVAWEAPANKGRLH